MCDYIEQDHSNVNSRLIESGNERCVRMQFSHLMITINDTMLILKMIFVIGNYLFFRLTVSVVWDGACTISGWDFLGVLKKTKQIVWFIP